MLFREIMDEDALAMMRRVLDAECARRSIQVDSRAGEEIARIVLDAFQAGMTEEHISRILRTYYP